MKEYALMAIVIFFCLLIGYIVCYFMARRKRDGSVVIEMTEDNERERVRFVLDLELDDIKNKKYLVLKIENNLSQNKQVV